MVKINHFKKLWLKKRLLILLVHEKNDKLRNIKNYRDSNVENGSNGSQWSSRLNRKSMLPERESDSWDFVEIRLNRNINNPMIGREL